MFVEERLEYRATQRVNLRKVSDTISWHRNEAMSISAWWIVSSQKLKGQERDDKANLVRDTPVVSTLLMNLTTSSTGSTGGLHEINITETAMRDRWVRRKLMHTAWRVCLAIRWGTISELMYGMLRYHTVPNLDAVLGRLIAEISLAIWASMLRFVDSTSESASPESASDVGQISEAI